MTDLVNCPVQPIGIERRVTPRGGVWNPEWKYWFVTSFGELKSLRSTPLRGLSFSDEVMLDLFDADLSWPQTCFPGAGVLGVNRRALGSFLVAECGKLGELPGGVLRIAAVWRADGAILVGSPDSRGTRGVTTFAAIPISIWRRVVAIGRSALRGVANERGAKPALPTNVVSFPKSSTARSPGGDGDMAG